MWIKRKIKKYILATVCFCALSGTSFSQNKISVHESQKKLYGNNIQSGSAKTKKQAIIPLGKAFPKKINTTVFGYLPYWVYLSNEPYKLNYELLSHIAFSDFPVFSDGTINTPPGWPWTDIISEAHSNGVKVIMSVTAFQKDTLHTFLNNQIYIYNFIAQAKKIMRDANLDGINVDFEFSLEPNPDKKLPLNNFISRLSADIKAEFTEAEISFAAPPINLNNAFDLEGLTNICDYIFIMAYDFYGWWSNSTGPVSPLAGTYINVTNFFDEYYKNIVNTFPHKLILGVPYYGLLWETRSDKEGAAVDSIKDFRGYHFYSELKSVYGDYQKLWSDNFRTSWYRKNIDTAWMQLWIDDDSSLGLKYDLAISKKLKGIGIWALGYDGIYDDLWNLIERKFIPSAVDSDLEKPQILANFELFNNYPNPFNPSTEISFSLPKRGYVFLSIYNLLGQLIYKSDSEIMEAGKNSFTWSPDLSGTQNPGSGIYLYHITYIDSYNQMSARSGKMLYLK